jgi:transcriptional repressor NrdR
MLIMHCPFCKHLETQVADSRVSDDGAAIRRRRSCLNAACNQRFTTFERAELSLPAVVKKNGARVAYERSKLHGSLALALRKRDVSIEQIETATHSIEAALLAMPIKEVHSEKLGELVMLELKKLDKVAYIRFASVYKKFTDVDEFTLAVRELG